MERKHRHRCTKFTQLVVRRDGRLHALSECVQCKTRRYLRHLSAAEAELGRFRDGTRFTVEVTDAAI